MLSGGARAGDAHNHRKIKKRFSRKVHEHRMKIVVHKNPNGDTRTAPKDVSFKQFQEANDSHIEDVKIVMTYLSILLAEKGIKHDHTKKSKEKLFYGDFIESMAGGIDFISGDWYQLHISKERHHLLSRCPDDVNLLDVIEMIVDCVCAGKTRSGEVRDLEISTDILEKALKNTVKLVDDMTVVE